MSKKVLKKIAMTTVGNEEYKQNSTKKHRYSSKCITSYHRAISDAV